MTTIFIDTVDKREGLPEYGCAKKCDRQDCPGPESRDEASPSWDSSYGLAGGGMGTYTFCFICEHVIDKTVDSDAE